MEKITTLEYAQKVEIAEQISQTNVILTGMPGAGKSTFVRELCSYNDRFRYISIGEITRSVEPTSGLGSEIQRLYITGQPWPDEFIMQLALPSILKYSRSGFLLDGIPRKLSEAEVLIKTLDQYDIKIDMVINIDTPIEVCKSRIDSRMKVEQRPESIDHYAVRLSMYSEGYLPIRDFFTNHRINIVNINGEKTPFKMAEDLFTQISNYNLKKRNE